MPSILNRRTFYVGHGVAFSRVTCEQHHDDIERHTHDGYTVTQRLGTWDQCDVCDEYAQQTAAELQANTQ